jgi:hypothetical protein
LQYGGMVWNITLPEALPPRAALQKLADDLDNNITAQEMS